MNFFSKKSQNLKIWVTSFRDVTKLDEPLLLRISDSRIFSTPTRLHGHQKSHTDISLLLHRAF
jgi:hypothetical protein